MSYFLELLVGLNLLIYSNNLWDSSNKWRPFPPDDEEPNDLKVMSNFYFYLTCKSAGSFSDQASKDQAEKIFKHLKKMLNIPPDKEESDIQAREAQLRMDKAEFARMSEAHRKEKELWDVDVMKTKSSLTSEREKLEVDKKKTIAAIRNHDEEKKILKEEQRIFSIEKEEQRKQKKEDEEQRQKLKNDKEALEKDRINLANWDSSLAMKEEAHRKRVEVVELREAELDGEKTKIKKDKVKFHEKKEQAVNAIRYVAIVVILGALVVIYKLLKKPGGGDGVSRAPRPRARGGGVNRTPERRVAAAAAAVLDICHLSLTRERNIFFENVLLPRLAESNIRPRTERRLLTQPADFDDIPPARCYIVHWTSQRMSIYSNSWHHQGLLRALGDSPVMIMVYDSEKMSTLPDPKIYDDAFGQIATEVELNEAAIERRLMTYRANEQFNQTQHATLRNWVNANIGEALNV